jgi:DNA-binding LacI/PurR family transcriptional regulator
LNHPEKVKRQTLDKVLEVVQEQNFTLNPIAQAMTLKETKKITMVIPTLRNPYFMEIANGAESFLTLKGYYLHIYNTNNNPNKEKDIFKQIIDKKINHMVDGIIIAGAGSFPPGYEEFLSKLNVPVVAIEVLPNDIPIDCVHIDDCAGTVMILEYLVSRKFNRIGFLIGPVDVPTTKRRMEVVYKFFEENGMELPSEYIVRSHYDNMEESLQATKQLLSLPTPPDVICGFSDMQLIGALRAIHECGLNCPKDISLIGCNNIAESAYSIPSLTTMLGHNEEIGKIAAATLINRIFHPSLPVQRILLPPSLVIRESC